MRSVGGLDIPLVYVYLGDMDGADLRRMRRRLKMSQSQLAEAIGMQKNSIARMERDERPIRLHTILSVKYLLLTKKKGVRRGNK